MIRAYQIDYSNALVRPTTTKILLFKPYPLSHKRERSRLSDCTYVYVAFTLAIVSASLYFKRRHSLLTVVSEPSIDSIVFSVGSMAKKGERAKESCRGWKLRLFEAADTVLY